MPASLISTTALLAEAASIHAKATNRIWIAVITVSALTLFPTISDDEPVTVSLPFSLGLVPIEVYHIAVTLLLASLLLALAASHAQQLRADRLARTIIKDPVAPAASLTQPLHPRDLYDILRESSITRVAPIAQLLQGDAGFAGSKAETKGILRVASFLVYAMLKVVTLAVLFLAPWLALLYSFNRSSESHMSTSVRIVAYIMFWLATGALALVAWYDTLYGVRVLKLFSSRTDSTV